MSHIPRSAVLVAIGLVASAVIVQPLTARARDPAPRVSAPDAPLTRTEPELAHVEPHLAVDPRDPRRLLVGTIVRSPDRDGAWHCAVLASGDGGTSWRRRDFDDMERCIDPWVLFTPGGAALFTALEIRGDVPHPGRFVLRSWRSEDGGVTWTGPETLGHAHEHPILEADRAGGRIWAVSRRMYAEPDGGEEHALSILESTDDGRSFVEVATHRPVALGMTPAGLFADAGGTLAIGFRDFAPDHDDATRTPLAHPRAWLLRAPDGGRSPGALRFVTEACGHADAFPGYPAFQGTGDRLVLACVRDDLDGLAVVRSADGGDRWLGPTVIAAGTAESPAHVRTPMLAVAPDGTVALAWYDRRHDPEHRCQDVYFTASTDGGATFAEPIRVTTETSCPDAPGNGSVAESWPMGGDYGALAATPSGDFRLVWADSRSGVFQLRQAVLSVDRDGEVAGRTSHATREAR